MTDNAFVEMLGSYDRNAGQKIIADRRVGVHGGKVMRSAMACLNYSFLFWIIKESGVLFAKIAYINSYRN